MTEDEARGAAARIAPDALPRIEAYARLLLEENRRQNLIARSTESRIWARHLLDSLQLAAFARPDDRTVIDVGSGAGLPGLVLALLDRWHVTLVEPRRKRADFLMHVAAELGIARVDVVAASVETVSRPADLVTARAVASIDDLFSWTRGCTHQRTRFILPKGRTARADVDLAAGRWHGLFHVEHSLTDPEAGVVIADRVSRR